MPWKTFRCYKGQRHYSGVYWSATVRDHVIYESRLELARLIFAAMRYQTLRKPCARGWHGWSIFGLGNTGMRRRQ